MQEKIDKLVQWLREQVASAGLNGAVVGISGGIDSAVVAHLIKRAFPDNSLGLIMPCKSHAKDMEDALKVVESCGIQHLVIDLTEVHKSLFGAVEAELKAIGSGMKKRRGLAMRTRGRVCA